MCRTQSAVEIGDINKFMWTTYVRDSKNTRIASAKIQFYGKVWALLCGCIVLCSFSTREDPNDMPFGFCHAFQTEICSVTILRCVKL